MHALECLALIWIGVSIAVYFARKTRLTPVLLYLAVASAIVWWKPFYVGEKSFGFLAPPRKS